MRKDKKNGMLAVGVILGISLGSFFLNNRNSTYSTLKDISTKFNKSGSVMVDNETRIDSTAVFDNPLKLRYYYTIITLDKDSLENETEVKEVLKDYAQNYYDTVPGMADFRKANVLLEYKYYDNKGKPLFDYTIKPTKINN